MLFVNEPAFLDQRLNIRIRRFIFVVMDITAALEKLTADLSVDEKATIKKELSAYLNHLLLNDFPALVQILYRVDVSENKIKSVLKENKEADAGDLLAELIIQREKQKTGPHQSIPPADSLADEERW